MKQHERIAWVDWVKALTIFAVVLGHTGPSQLNPFVYAFHVPAFFVISGYLYKPNDWKQTFFQFAIPIVFFSLLCFLYSLVISRFDFETTWEKSTWFVYKLDETRPLFTGLWFIEVLFVCKVLLGDGGFLFVRKNYKNISILCVILAVLMDVFEVQYNWYISRIVQCFPFMGLGLYLKESNVVQESLSGNKKARLAALVGGGIIHHTHTCKQTLRYYVQ